MRHKNDTDAQNRELTTNDDPDYYALNVDRMRDMM